MLAVQVMKLDFTIPNLFLKLLHVILGINHPEMRLKNIQFRPKVICLGLIGMLDRLCLEPLSTLSNFDAQNRAMASPRKVSYPRRAP